MHAALTAAFTEAVAASGQLAVPKPPTLQASIAMTPTVTVEQAAKTLGLSRRQTRRLAAQLGGRIIAGRWLLDQQAIAEHLEGRQRWIS